MTKFALSGKRVKVDVEAAINKSAKICIVYIKIDNVEKEVFRKYIYEKCLATGVNYNNHIYSAIYGSSGIVIAIPENKITQNVILFYNYLAKHNKVEKEFKIMVSGKCKNFMTAVKNEAPKITRMLEALDVISKRTITGGLMNVKSSSGKTDGGQKTDSENDEDDKLSFTFDSSSTTTMMYLSIIIGDKSCDINKMSGKIKVEFFQLSDAVAFSELFKMSKIFQYRIKNFLTQSGNVGKQSANDKDGKVFKAKVKAITDSQNLLAKIYSNIRGFNYEFSEIVNTVEREHLTPIKLKK